MSTETNVLCAPCRSIFAEDWKAYFERTGQKGLPELRVHHESDEDLRACASQHHCPLCKTVVRNGHRRHGTVVYDISTRDEEDGYRFVVVTVQFWHRSPGGFQSPLCEVSMRQIGDPLRSGGAMVSPSAKSPPRLETNTSSQSSQEFVKMKFSTCEANHVSCRRWDQFVPSRLLDTGDSSQPFMKIVEKGDVSAVQYATLSYCWGQCQVLKLTSRTASQYAKSIAFDEMPLTFQHAVSVIRWLGIRYLWIDSLCILQDSAEDWNNESSMMFEIYRHGKVNIAASSAKDANGGLFFDREPAEVQLFTADAPYQDPYSSTQSSPKGNNEAALPIGSYIHHDCGRWARLQKQPLNQRAWVLQERALSPRTMHFTNTEIFWQCLEDFGSEAVPNLQDEIVWANTDISLSDYMGLERIFTQFGYWGTLLRTLDDIWGILVVEYSACGLTKDTDKLVAIHGIVKEMEKLTGDDCVAGIWRRLMPGTLMWRVDWKVVRNAKIETSLENQRPIQWRAPSWSWASLNLPVYSWGVFKGHVYHMEVLEASVSRETNGKINSAKLRLRGPLVEAEFTDRNQTRYVGEKVDIDKAEDGMCDVMLSMAGGICIHCEFYMDGTQPYLRHATLLLVTGNYMGLMFMILVLSEELGGSALQRVGILEFFPAHRENKVELCKVADDTEAHIAEIWKPYERVMDVI